MAGTPDVVGQVRAERAETGTGRTYTLTYRGQDVAGNTALCTTTVRVPKNQGGTAGATFDETTVVVDAYVDVTPVLTETVTTPVATAPTTENNEGGVSTPDALPLRLFLPVIVNGSTGEQTETTPTESEDATVASVPPADAPPAESNTVESAPLSEAQTDAGHTLYLPVSDQ